MRQSFLRYGLGLLLISWIGGAAIAPAQTPDATGTDGATAGAATNAAHLSSRDLRRTPVVRVFEEARAAVVNITATSILETRSPFDDMFQFFNNVPGFDPGRLPGRRQVQATSLGSGFVIHPDGYIVTNAHVVARSTERKVIFADKSEYPAQIVALDQEHDLAILKIDAKAPLHALPLGRSNDLMVGETVVAIGNPFGYGHTCTTGIVSAVGRDLQVSDDVSFKGLIQTDASINPGNSGGPLLNVLGQLIGVNTAIRGDAQNIGFAIPVDHLRAMLPEMLDVERRYGFISGLSVEDAGNSDITRCRVREVVPDSPADRAGLGREPLLVETVDGKPVQSAVDYTIALIGKHPGETVNLTVRNRANQTKQISFTLTARPKPDGAKLLAGHFGIQAEELSPRMARALNMNGVQGLQVTEVEDHSPADAIGLRRGDIIIQLGRHPAASLQDMGAMLEKVAPGDAVGITVLRVQGPMIIRSSAMMKAR